MAVHFPAADNIARSSPQLAVSNSPREGARKAARSNGAELRLRTRGQRFSLDERGHVPVDHVGRDARLVPSNHLTAAVDEKLGKVPLDAAGIVRVGAFQELVNGVNIGGVDVDLVEDGKLGSVLLARKLADVVVVARFLVAKLVAGKG
eukprot:CAMPEP_0198724458 /NCGR_PEP_ID=MMETSP1475-20131203/1923_1 /TAXON_ID= ORGANISM="Unidentified sp., Strain CCMP1999" /NCGR_SAMPLE_ID=MMETSP1475 /ASSEMBLY_ACC=CAM_ASM_001111 /LENGTH=147 /DNA_ID=CAMNT_0044485991 /DNA_START=236 /DNA_END=679 /DNA_ORIENTATION=+